MNPKDLTELLETVGKLRSDVIYLVCVCFLVFLVFQSIKMWLNHRHERAMAREKNRRNERFEAAMNGLALSISQSNSNGEARTKAITDCMCEVRDGLVLMKDAMNELISRTNGTINKKDAVRLIERSLFQDCYRDMCIIIKSALTDHFQNYATRPEFVSRKIRTELGDVLLEARKYLRSFNLSVAADGFFILARKTPGTVQEGERFLLCDAVWNRIQPLFGKTLSEAQRLEEAYLIVENEIRDYMASISSDTIADIKPLSFSDVHEPSQAATMARRTTQLMDSNNVKPATVG